MSDLLPVQSVTHDKDRVHLQGIPVLSELEEFLQCRMASGDSVLLKHIIAFAPGAMRFLPEEEPSYVERIQTYSCAEHPGMMSDVTLILPRVAERYARNGARRRMGHFLSEVVTTQRKILPTPPSKPQRTQKWVWFQGETYDEESANVNHSFEECIGDALDFADRALPVTVQRSFDPDYQERMEFVWEGRQKLVPAKSSGSPIPLPLLPSEQRL